MSGLTETYIAVLRGLEVYWQYIGESQRVWRKEGRWTAPRTVLRKLRDLGLIEVRTVTVSNWLCEPRIEDREGSWVEARLTPQGEDVKYTYLDRDEPELEAPPFDDWHF